MNHRTLFIFGVLLFAGVLRASDDLDYSRITFVGAGKGKAMDRDQFVTLVVEGPFVSFDKSRIPDDALVPYVNRLLKDKGVSYLAVYAREGIKFGDLVKAIDALRKTAAKDIGVSTIELAVGREP